MADSFDLEFRAGYEKLYEQYIESRYRPALSLLCSGLSTLLTEKFPSDQRLRLRVEPGRIKSKNRLLLKAENLRNRDAIITKPEDVFTAIYDVVGTRVTCNTTEDVSAVVAEIEAVVTSDGEHRSFLKGREEWKKDYVASPKASGYRAVNLTLAVRVPQGEQALPVSCEVQVRTLLQHAWGELTHEDTYKPGVTPPPLVVTLSKRLADALAVLDDIALDLRKELERGETLSPVASDETRAPAHPGLSTSARIGAEQGGEASASQEEELGPSAEGVAAGRMETTRAPSLTPGDKVMGAVVSTGQRYALVQLRDGRKGIIHYSSLKSSPWDYVDVSHIVSVGDTIEVKVVSVDASGERIELGLVGPDNAPSRSRVVCGGRW